MCESIPAMSRRIQRGNRSGARVARLCVVGLAACQGTIVGDGSGLDGTGALSDAGMADGSGAASGGAPGTDDAGGGSIDAMPVPLPSLWGMAVGHAWSLDEVLNGSTRCRLDWTITGTISVDGRDAFVMSTTSSCGGAGSEYVAVEAKDMLEYGIPQSSQIVWLRYDPPEDGHTFLPTNLPGQTYVTWHVVDPQTVPAGTFADCWQAEYTTSDGTDRGSGTIYCRGVGVVRDYDQFGTTRTLISKNF
jgi:hypothetical protein